MFTTNFEAGAAESKVAQSQTKNEIMSMLNVSASLLTADDVEYMEHHEKCLISTHKTYAPKEYLILIKGIKTLTLGDLHMVQAQAKNGKTTLINIFVAAILAGKWGVVEFALDRKGKIIVFDTEQFKSDTFRQYETMMFYGGMGEEDFCRLKVYNLREMNWEQRRRFIIKTIEREKPMLAVIDGIRDLVVDINDPVGCPQFVDEMMQLASRTYCAIIGVLHNNPNEGKARGWVGTEWINKCGYSFEPQKSGNVVTVKNPVFRGAPVPDWQFTFDADGLPVCDELLVNQDVTEFQEAKAREELEKRELKTKNVLDKVMLILQENNNQLNRAEFVAQIVERGIMKRSAAYEFVKSQIDLPTPPFKELKGKMVMC